VKGGADPELALDADRSAVALHDTQAHGQSETGPSDLGLGREERLEDRPGAPARCGAGVPTSTRTVSPPERRPERQGAAPLMPDVDGVVDDGSDTS